MADVKVPPLLHKMSMAAQKAWYKKQGMEMPKVTSGRSAAQAKKDVGEINKKKAREVAIATAAAASKKNKELVKSSERVRKMAANALAFGGQRPGGDLTTNQGIVSYVRSGGTLKAGRLGEEAVDEAVMKTKLVNKEKLKNYVRGLGTKAVVAGKVPFDQRFSPLRAGRKALKQESVATAQKVMDRANVVANTNPDPKKRFAAGSLANKAKLRTINPTGVNTGIVRGGGNKTYRMITGKVPPYQLTKKTNVSEEVELDEVTKQEAEKMLGGPVKTRTGSEPKGKLPLGFRAARNLARKAMKKGGPVNETGEYTEIGHPPEHSIDVDPSPSDALKQQKRKKPVQYKPGMRNGSGIKESTEDKMMKKGKLLAKAVMAKQSKHPIAQTFGEAVKDAADVGEYDYEGDMAKSQLRSILANAKRMHDMLDDQTNLPEWVQSKITLAEDYILTAANYMEGEMNEEVEQIDEKYTGKVNGTEFSYHASENQLENDDKLHKAIARQNRHLEDDEVKAIIHSGGYSKHVVVGGKKHRVEHDDNAFNEEVVTEAEGKVAVTPKEKELAAHHGDPKKITYGDVIKARLKSAAAKAMNKGK